MSFFKQATIITDGGPGFVTSCWKYFVDANFETENFEWKIYIPCGDWTHVPLYPSGTPIHEAYV